MACPSTALAGHAVFIIQIKGIAGEFMSHPLLADAPGDAHLLLGNEAIVRGALEAGINMVTCYPGTP